MNKNIKINDFVGLLEYLDHNEEGQNLRMYPDGSSYLADDNGVECESFEDIYHLIEYLRDLKYKYDSGILTKKKNIIKISFSRFFLPVSPHKKYHHMIHIARN